MSDENTGVVIDASNPGAAPVTPETITTPAAPAEAPAPAAEPAPALVAPPEAPVTVLNSTADEAGIVEYEPTGDPALDVALGFLGNLGFAGEDEAMQRAAKGDFALLEAKLAVLGPKAAGWERMIALAKSAHTASEAKRAESIKATTTAIMSVAGSAEQWKTVVDWAAANATPEEKAEINKMIDGGPVQARAAAQLLVSAFRSAKGTTVAPANAVRDAAGAVPNSGNGPLNYKDYAAQVRELKTKLGNRMETSPEYADLQRRLRK